ncbi:ABC transporter ATP-binding protein [Granulosicoccus sp. 3-233]|uniref:ABC transporter ATP-binding protein n=1 Tax=Granulosicoccus sp. 3-233 TaxID=3417969 RepID=UPI003D354968
MAAISVKGVSRQFGSFRALDKVSIEFADGGFHALLGPSGSGKTTLLRVIAGFEYPDTGTITIGGESVESIPVEKRQVGLMFQNYALFPHMSVYDNIAFGLTVRHTARAEIRHRVHEVLELVRLQGLEKRKPAELSGGQKQRVALARAIVFRPRVLLLDEPLSALDKSLRLDMQVELKRIQREVGITTLLVTHDQEEALTLSDRIGILDHGVLVQQGAPLDIYERPATPFAATFLGDANLLSTQAGSYLPDAAGCSVRLESGSTIHSTNTGDADGSDIVCAVRPEKMFLLRADETPEPGMNVLPATVIRHLFAGSSLNYELAWHETTLRVFAQNNGAPLFAEGCPVTVAWHPSHTIVMNA